MEKRFELNTPTDTEEAKTSVLKLLAEKVQDGHDGKELMLAFHAYTMAIWPAIAPSWLLFGGSPDETSEGYVTASFTDNDAIVIEYAVNGYEIFTASLAMVMNCDAAVAAINVYWTDHVLDRNGEPVPTVDHTHRLYHIEEITQDFSDHVELHINEEANTR